MKRTVRWALVLLVLMGTVFAIGPAGAEKGKTLEVRFSVPAEDMPRLRSGEGLSGKDEASEATFSLSTGGSTCTAYTYVVNNGSSGSQVAKYRYQMGILDDPRPGPLTADTLYRSDLTTDDELTYTFYQTGTYVLFVYRYDASGNSISPVIYKRIYIDQNKAGNPLTAAVNTAAAACNKGNDFDTAVEINDYLAEVNTYDYSLTYYSPEAVLLGSDYGFGHTSVCNGYSRAYQLIAAACGLECRRVAGTAGGGGHAWNAVKVNGNWYHVDPTWNDSKLTMNGQAVDNSPLRHIYMLLNDGSMLADHSNFSYPQGRVSCITLEDNYFIHEDKWSMLIPDGTGMPMANLQAALDSMSGAAATIEADYGTTVWREDGGQLGFSKGKLTINGNIVAYALSRTDLYRTDDDTTPIRGNFLYTYDEAGTPASKLTGEITAGTTDPGRVYLTMPAGSYGRLPVHTNQSVTITMAPGATQAGFYDGEFWMSMETNQQSITMDVPFNVAGEKTLMARAYYEGADGTGEWIYSNAETRTFVPGEPLDQAEFSISNYSVEQGTILPVTFYEVDDAETYLFQVADDQQKQVYQSLSLNTEDLELMPGGWRKKIINVPTDGMAAGKYAIRVYASAAGREDSCSEALFTVNKRTAADEPFISADKTQPLVGQQVVIMAHIPGAAFVGVKCEDGEHTDDLFCTPQAGDTGMWACNFDRAGIYTLSVSGWSGEVWGAQDTLNNPDLPESALSVTVTVTALEEEEEPEAHVTIPRPLMENDTVTVSFDEFPGAISYSVSCAQENSGDPVYSRENAIPFTAAIPAASLMADQTYLLKVEVRRSGYYNYSKVYQLIPAAGCPHTEMTEETELHYTYYTKDGNEHITVPVYATTHSCAVCGYSDPDEVPVYTAEWGGVTEAHEDGNEDGLCDLCGASMAQSWGWDFVNGNTLILSGSGAVDDFATPDDLPWSHVAEIGGTKRVIIENGITGLGRNVLAGFGDGIRADFYTAAQPNTDADTFGGKEVICRYYDNSSEWDSTAGGATVTWIYLPVREGGDAFALAYYQEDGKNTPTWHLRENIGASSANDTEISRDAAMEYSQEQIRVILDAIPTVASGDRAVIENRNIAMAAVFNPGCTGSYTLDFSAFPDIDVQLDIDAPNLALTIIGPEGETDPLFSMDVRNARGITCDWTIADLRLRDTREGCVTDVYVDGDVEKLSYYDATSDMPFTGTLTVTGRIDQGTVYGQNELEVPGITLSGDPVRFGSIDTATFTYENTATIPAGEQVIEYDNTEQKSRLNPAVNRQGIGDLTPDMFRLTYQYWGPDRVGFGVDPKEGTGLGGQGGYIENILDAEYNPNFTTDDIIRGGDTTVYFMDTGETAYTLNSGTDGSGNRTGIGALYLQNCNVTVNCPVGFIKTWQYKNDLGPVNLTINDTVSEAEVMFFRDGGRIHLGPNGTIQEGVWDRGIRGYREIGTVRGECDYAVDGTLCVLSAKDGQQTRAIPASDKAVSAAAGLSGQTTASMDVNDAAIADEETDVLNEYLAAHGLTGQNIVNVFDVSVAEYTVDEEGNALNKVGDIDRLNRGVPVAVGNDSGEAVSVVRLHKDGNGSITAERLTGSVDGVKVQFTSDLFSTYVLLSGEAELDPANLTKLVLPASLRRIEESAFEGIAAQAVIVPRNCGYIGSKAFRDCPNLMYIEYYEGTEVEDDAFAECNSLQVKVIPVQ